MPGLPAAPQGPPGGLRRCCFRCGSRCGTIGTVPVRPPARRSPCSMPPQHRPSTCHAAPRSALLADAARSAPDPDPDACLRPTRTRGSRCLRPRRRLPGSRRSSLKRALQQGHRGRLGGHLELLGLNCALDIRSRGRRRGAADAPAVWANGGPRLGSVSARRAARLLPIDALTHFRPDTFGPGRTRAMCWFDMLPTWG
mgnify:CR=1 FL=1